MTEIRTRVEEQPASSRAESVTTRPTRAEAPQTRYDAAPFDASNSDPTQRCSGLTRAVWSVPCAWQAIKAMPETCAGNFKPTPPDGKSRNEPDPFPELDAYERYELGYAPGANFEGSCDAHAFCFECLDDSYAGGVNPYCRAVFARYSPISEGRGSETRVHTHHMGFFADLDYWCQPGVLATLERAAKQMQLRPADAEP